VDSVTDPYDRIISFLDRKDRYLRRKNQASGQKAFTFDRLYQKTIKSMDSYL
jgi:hypothetical protein